ncbi:MAG TPA: hypothetical protein VFU63_02295 [Ktedonobacterales bacterium]|nr:hypothetical protein [Ktedonobacterales bacterium]
MLSLPPALFLVLLELTVGSFVSLYFLDVRGDTSRGFVLFQGGLYFLFAVLTLLAMNAFASPTVVHGRGLDESWLNAQGPLVVAFLLLMIPWNLLLWLDRQPRPARGKAARQAAAQPPTRLRLARFGAGAITALTGATALFVVGMAYRSLADSRLGGAFVVATFLAGGIALGGVMTAMLLGHWYLNTPTASGKPLEFATIVMLAALALELVFSLAIGPSTAHTTLKTINISPGTQITTGDSGVVISTPTLAPGQTAPVTTDQVREAPLSTGAMLALQIIMGLMAPLILGGVALWLTRGRSFQSATGMLYLAVSFIFIGEILGRGLLLLPVF